MPDVIKPGPGGEGTGDEDEQRQDDTVMDAIGNSGRDFPLQVCYVLHGSTVLYMWPRSAVGVHVVHVQKDRQTVLTDCIFW